MKLKLFLGFNLVIVELDVLPCDHCFDSRTD